MFFPEEIKPRTSLVITQNFSLLYPTRFQTIPQHKTERMSASTSMPTQPIQQYSMKTQHYPIQENAENKNTLGIMCIPSMFSGCKFFI